VNGVSSLAGAVSVASAAPGILQFGNKRAVVQNDDYTVNDTGSPAKGGSYVVAYLTGCGVLDNPVATGGAAASEPLSRPRGAVSATLGGQSVEVVFAGMTPGFVGLAQMNFKVPNMPAGDYPLVISVNGAQSNAAMVTVK
jgi:uncharacterized protein (TIGR03437 family)